MFLDDELKQIWEAPTELADRANRIYKACMTRIDQTSKRNFINSVKRVDLSFRLFAKRTISRSGAFVASSISQSSLSSLSTKLKT